MLKDKIPYNNIKKHLLPFVVEETSLPEELVESIIDWAMIDTRDATQKHKTIEIAGWGKLIQWPKKLNKKITKLTDTVGRMREKNPLDPRITSIEEQIEELKWKLT